MRRLLKIVLPLLVLGMSAAAGLALIATGPDAKRRPPRPVVPTIEVMTVSAQDYRIRINTRGTVSPRTQSTLIPEVSGRVVEVAPNFRNGGFFETNELLLRIDPRDYETNLTVARADLAQARATLAEETARADQALRDWRKLGGGDKASDLVLRKPQLANAEAAVAAARAQLERAQTNLERTRIRAPYAGRVLDKRVDIGQYVSPGTVLATVYAVDYVEIRLPLTDAQVAFLDLPETYRGESPASSTAGPPVILSAQIGKERHEWAGKIVRTEGSIDTQSRQLFVVAQVDDPYARRPDRPPLKVGQFVRAEIEARLLRNVLVLPAEAVRGSNQVLVVTPEGAIQRREVQVIWRDKHQLVVTEGLSPGERISLTPLPYAADGTKVNMISEERSAPKQAEKKSDSKAELEARQQK